MTVNTSVTPYLRIEHLPKSSASGALPQNPVGELTANVINSDQSNQNNIVSFHQYADDTQLCIGTNSSTLLRLLHSNPALRGSTTGF